MNKDAESEMLDSVNDAMVGLSAVVGMIVSMRRGLIEGGFSVEVAEEIARDWASRNFGEADE